MRTITDTRDTITDVPTGVEYQFSVLVRNHREEVIFSIMVGRENFLKILAVMKKSVEEIKDDNQS